MRLDDYLDREIGGDHTEAAVAPKSAASLSTRALRFATEEEGWAARASNPAAVRQFQPSVLPPRPAPTFPQRFKQRPVPVKAPRVQLNMTPEVQRMVQELVGHFCAFGLQKDTSASEVFEALVNALHESRDQLDLSNVPSRGQWGSPTARAFRTNLKNVVIDAIARHRQRLG